MASTYPVALDALPTTHSDTTNEVIHAATDNDQSDAINHIEAELGVIPKDTFTSVAARLAALEFITFNNRNVTTYTLVAGDKTSCNSFNNSAACVVTVPANATVPFKIGTVIAIRQGAGAGQVTIQGATGVTILEPNNSFKTQAPGAWVYLIKTNTDTWDLTGATA